MESLGWWVIIAVVLFFLIRRNDKSGKKDINRKANEPSRGAKSRVLDASAQSCWLPMGHAVEIQGYSVPGGMIYVGDGLANGRGIDVEPSLINPKLKVNRREVDYSGDHMGYWPSYSNIHPASRAAYLEWLAGGRKDSSANIGYVFLFFYGLERRCLLDPNKHSVSATEILEITREVQRLRDLYAEKSGSFDGYSARFLDAIKLNSSPETILSENPASDPNMRNKSEILVKFALGKAASADQPIPVGWALAWVCQDPEIKLRTSAKRCPEEFQALFRARYAERYGEGLVIKPGKTQARFYYAPASNSLSGVHDSQLYNGPSVPDVLTLKKPRRLISEFTDEVMDELDSYSRFVGREKESRGSFQALALMPKPISKLFEKPEVAAFREKLFERLGTEDIAEIPGQWIFEQFPTGKPDQMTKKEAVLLAQAFEKIGLGVVPDVRFTNHKPTLAQPAVIFRLREGAPSAPSKEFELAALLMRLSIMVADSDGEISSEEEQHLERHLESGLGLEAGERDRLRAHLQWLPKDAATRGMTGLKKRVEALDIVARTAIGNVLVTVASSDGEIDAREVAMLQKLYRLLGLDPNNVYMQAHAIAAAPVTVRSAQPQTDDYKIPKKPGGEVSQGEPPRVALDEAALSRKRHDTEQVKALLSSIFSDEPEEEEIEIKVLSNETSNSSIAGLDSEHSVLVREIISQQKWTRVELEVLASKHSLLLDGALDTINEAALDLCGAPLIEEDADSFEIDVEIVEEMTA
ncbi:MAG: hypothetical protein EA349_01535 [Halomonadaceae bacterium]|nr:MAG: hypothetical protein EA349_01535 [Halomonadaceae bacterium]